MDIKVKGQRPTYLLMGMPLADASVVIGNVLDDPLDRVEGVGRLVDLVGPDEFGIDRFHHLELAFGAELPAHV